MLTKAAILALIAAHSGEPQMSRAPARGVQIALTCFASGEQASGMNKICYYNCLGSQAAITISAVALCPLTIER